MMLPLDIKEERMHFWLWPVLREIYTQSSAIASHSASNTLAPPLISSAITSLLWLLPLRLPVLPLSPVHLTSAPPCWVPAIPLIWYCLCHHHLHRSWWCVSHHLLWLHTRKSQKGYFFTLCFTSFLDSWHPQISFLKMSRVV